MAFKTNKTKSDLFLGLGLSLLFIGITFEIVGSLIYYEVIEHNINNLPFLELEEWLWIGGAALLFLAFGCNILHNMFKPLEEKKVENTTAQSEKEKQNEGISFCKALRETIPVKLVMLDYFFDCFGCKNNKVTNEY